MEAERKNENVKNGVDATGYPDNKISANSGLFTDMEYDENLNMIDLCSELINANAFAVHNNLTFTYVMRDYAEGYIDIKPETRNPYGMVHGGAYFALADVSAGLAARSDGKKYVTQSGSVNYVRSVRDGRIRCRAKVINRGTKICLLESKIYDDNDNIVFCGTFTYCCVDGKV